MATVNRTKKIKSLQEFLQKKVKRPSTPPSRNVLEQLMYSACLENATYEDAGSAFAVLEHHYIDWNEIRISTAKELADSFPSLPEPVAAGERIRRILHDVFNTVNQFDLEELRKRGTSHAMEYLHSLPACTRFMADFMHQSVFGNHTIPVDERTMRVFRLLGLTKVLEEEGKEMVSGLERAIFKNEGAEFTALLHQFAAIHAAEAKIENLRNLLRPLDAEVMSRPWEAPIFTNKPMKPKAPIRLVSPVVPSFLPSSFAAAEDEEEGHSEFVGVREVEFIPHELPLLSEEKATKLSTKTTKKTQNTQTGATAGSKSPSVAPKEKEKPKAQVPEKGKSKGTEKKKEEGKGKEVGSTSTSPTRRLQQKKPR